MDFSSPCKEDNVVDVTSLFEYPPEYFVTVALVCCREVLTSEETLDLVKELETLFEPSNFDNCRTSSLFFRIPTTQMQARKFIIFFSSQGLPRRL